MSKTNHNPEVIEVETNPMPKSPEQRADELLAKLRSQHWTSDYKEGVATLRDLVEAQMMLEWLKLQVVEVRTPLVYGSRENFICSPIEQDGGDDEPSNLCQAIKQAMEKGE